MSTDKTFIECIRLVRGTAEAMLRPDAEARRAAGNTVEPIDVKKWQALIDAMDALWPGVTAHVELGRPAPGPQANAKAAR